MSGTITTITTADGTFNAYVARPGAAKAPAVSVIQEIFGVNAVMRAIADDLAAHGYLAICPDLFWRIEPGINITDQSEADWAKAFELYAAYNVDKGVEDIDATLAAVRADEGCDGKVGSVGFCLGGLLSFLTATRTDIDAAVCFYGVGIENKVDEAKSLRRPVMLHVAEEEQFVPKAAQTTLTEALSGHTLVTLHSYAGRDHAFARKGGEQYDAADATLAEQRTLAFFAANLYP